MDDCEDKIFRNSSVYMESLLGKHVEIETLDNIVYSGIIYVIDPIYKTTVLHINWQSQEDYQTVLILYHAIKSFKLLSNEVHESYLQRPAELQPASDIVCKREQLKKWMEHMFINISESGNYLKIDDHLVIVPPYGPENCICNNTIILDRIRNIISIMPADFI